MPGGNYIQPANSNLQVDGYPLRKRYERVWADVLAASGNQDIHLFFEGSEVLNDVTLRIEIDTVALKNDGTEGYSSKKILTVKKDGAADAVAVGAVTTVNEHRDDAGATITPSVLAGNFIRVAYTTGGVDQYRWTIFATITQTTV